MNLNYYRHAERSGEPLVRETKHNMKELYPSTSRLTFVLSGFAVQTGGQAAQGDGGFVRAGLRPAHIFKAVSTSAYTIPMSHIFPLDDCVGRH